MYLFYITMSISLATFFTPETPEVRQTERWWKDSLQCVPTSFASAVATMSAGQPAPYY